VLAAPGTKHDAHKKCLGQSFKTSESGGREFESLRTRYFAIFHGADKTTRFDAADYLDTEERYMGEIAKKAGLNRESGAGSHER
jgi:hypothetical protein